MARLKRIWFSIFFFAVTGFTQARLRALFAELVELDIEDFRNVLLPDGLYRVQAYGATVHVKPPAGPEFTLNENHIFNEVYIHEWFPERKTVLELGPEVTYQAGFYEVFRTGKLELKSFRWAAPLRRLAAGFPREAKCTAT